MLKCFKRPIVFSMMIFCLVVLVVGCAGEKDENKDLDRSHDSSEGVGTDSFSLSILPLNPRGGEELQVIVKGEARNLTYEWKHNGEEIPGASFDTLAGIDSKKGDEVIVVASTDTEYASAHVIIGNTPPIVKSVTVSPQPLRSGTDVFVSVEGEDVDEDSLYFDYQWVINGEESLLNTNSRLNGKEFERGDNVSVRVLVSDTEHVGNFFTTPAFVVVNAYPKITSVPPQAFKGWRYVYQVKVDDPDEDSLVFSLLQAPKGMVIDSNGRITWDIKKGSSGSYIIEVEVVDGQGGVDTQHYELSIGVSGE